MCYRYSSWSGYRPLASTKFELTPCVPAPLPSLGTARAFYTCAKETRLGLMRLELRTNAIERRIGKWR